MIVPELYAAVAERVLTTNDGRVVRIAVGAPVKPEGEADWFCPWRISGLGADEINGCSGGVDGVQALLFALTAVGDRVAVEAPDAVLLDSVDGNGVSGRWGLPARQPDPGTSMSYFDIEGYEPQWLSGYREFMALHSARLQALVGRRLRQVWLLWDRADDEWFADGPVVLDFDDARVEINHQKFDDLSITWNSIDPIGQSSWTYGDDNDSGAEFHLAWRHDAMAVTKGFEGLELTNVELLEWTGRDWADGSVAVSFVFADRRLTIYNALDENGLEFGALHPNYRSHPVGTR